MKKPAKVIPLGAPLDTPDEDLDMLALVTPGYFRTGIVNAASAVHPLRIRL